MSKDFGEKIEKLVKKSGIKKQAKCTYKIFNWRKRTKF